MGEPARRAPDHADVTSSGEELTTDFVHRWVELPNGRMELQEFPLTPEYFLDPQIGDQVVQSFRHWRFTSRLWEIVSGHAASLWREVLVLADQKLLWGHREWRRPSPDIAVIPEFPGAAEWEGSSFDVAKTGYRPRLIIEVVSFSNAKIRKTDLVDKVDLYEREKIREYLALDPPRRSNGNRFQWIGYRLDDQGRYRRIEPDDKGRLLAETVGLLFGVSPDGRDFEVFNARTGERLLGNKEIAAEAVRQAAEAVRQAGKAVRQADQAVRQADREAAARKAAEAEVARLREEVARLKRSGD